MNTFRKLTSANASLALATLLLAGHADLACAQATTSVTRTVSIDYDDYGQVIRETVEPDDPNLKLVTEYARDPTYGVVTARTLKWRDPATATDKIRTAETTTYDTRKRYPRTVANALGHQETREHDEASGNLLSLTGPNLLTTSWTYDAWGRKTREDRADSTATTWAYRRCVDNCNGAVSVTVTQHWHGSSQTTVPTEVFADSLARTLGTRTWGFNGEAVVEERVYDAAGRLVQTARARFASAASVWIYHEHDAIGRVQTVRAPNDNGIYENTSIAHDGLSTTTTNAKSQTRTEVRNALDKTKRVIDAQGSTTHYLYDPWGNLSRTTDPLGNQINAGYDRLGRKRSLTDPNLGSWSYDVDPLGQTWRQVDAKLQQTTFEFDELGRMTRRLEPDMDARWTYDSSPTKGIGRLYRAATYIAGALDYERYHGYDSLGRPWSVRHSLDWEYAEETVFDGFARPSQQRLRRSAKGGSGGPTVSFVKSYNAYGHVAQLQRQDGTGTPVKIWAPLEIDAEGRVRREELGATLLRQRGFNGYTGRLASVLGGPNNGSGAPTGSHQNDTYLYDSLGNLTYRARLISTSGALMQESFGYDTLNRLDSSTVNGSTKSYGYDAVGNLKSKSGVGSYAYGVSGAASVRPNAVSSISGSVAGIANPSFSYDANGNLASGLGREYGWTASNMVSTIDRRPGGGAVDQRTGFIYSPERMRVRQYISPVSGGTVGTATSTIWYAGAIEKEIDSSANTTTLRFSMPLGLGFVEEKHSGSAIAATAVATRNARYFLKDHLGSVNVIVDDAGTVLQRLSYDAWGRRRNADGSDDAGAYWGTLKNTQDHSGYTGHEHLDQVALVNMNGRLYDPITARMLSADPTVPDAYDAQALNRYSYVLNNALKFTDPTGLSPDDPGPSQPDEVVDVGTIVITGTRPLAGVVAPRMLAGVPIIIVSGPAHADGMRAAQAIKDGLSRVGRAYSNAWKSAKGWLAKTGAGSLVWSFSEREAILQEATEAAGADQGKIGENALGADTYGTPPGGPDGDDPNEQKVYRGGDKLEARSIDVRIDKATGLVKPGRGISLSSDAEALTQRFGSAKEIVSVPNELQIVRTSGSHFEIAPRAPMTMERYQQLLNQVVMK